MIHSNKLGAYYWGRKKGIVDEVEQAIMNEREQCALVVENRARECRKMATFMARERAIIYKEIADALDRAAMFVRERETLVV